MITESLRKNDLTDLVNPVFEIDLFKSKIGDDKDIIVLSFTVDTKEPAEDLENFIEMGYEFVLDSDVTPGENEDGKYKVFVEIERNRYAVKEILDLLDGIKRLTNLPKMRFRYFKNFRSQEANKENLTNTIPVDKESYDIATSKDVLENFNNFFSNSYVDDIQLLDESIIFKNIWREPLKFKIIKSGPIHEVYNSIKGPIMIESNAIAESLYLTKYIGNYNITKIGNVFIFENKNYAVAMERQ